ncbi:MAG TPA: ribosome maturation factor RimM [Atopostipes sp.]|nr:ribosome maturation factor RimM [Atopostipes sp.]
MTTYLNVGKIVNTHGIKGEVRVQSITDKPEERYRPGSKLVIEVDNDDRIPVTIKSHRKHKNFDLLTFEEYSSINDVESFKNKMLQIDEDLLPELEDGVYYESQVIGSDVLDEEGNSIGRLKEILFMPANDVWVVERPDKKDLLLPFIESVILNVDTEQKEITVHVLEGLDEDEN